MTSLPPPARYTPWIKGVYDVSPGLKPLGTDFGNGELDQKLFQFDSTYPLYRANKDACLAEDVNKYLLRHRLAAEVEIAAIELISTRLVEENPSLFRRTNDGIFSGLTGEEVPLTLDALSHVIPEDVAIVQTRGNEDWIAYLHLCSPSHWAGSSKIGRSFFETHTPIPGFERVNAVASAMVTSMIHRGPFVRFVWGVASDNRLNHHPVPPPGEDPQLWHGGQFKNGWWVRVERQVIWGLPTVNAALFFIHVGFVEGQVVINSPALFDPLLSATRGMSPASAIYKGTKDFLALYPESAT